MAVDQAGNEILSDDERKLFAEHDRKVDEYMDELLRILLRPPTPKSHTLPLGSDRMRYAPLERELMTAYSTLARGWQRWKEGRS